jgi:TPR repeat protein
LYGDGVEKDEKAGIALLTELANRKNGAAINILTQFYDETRNIQEVIKWRTKGVADKHADSQCDLGVRYLRGEGVPKDETKAIELLQAASSQGHIEGQRELGMLYVINGKTVLKAVAALALLKAGIPAEQIEAQRKIGMDYVTKGKALIQAAADQDHPDALAMLAASEQNAAQGGQQPKALPMGVKADSDDELNS